MSRLFELISRTNRHMAFINVSTHTSQLEKRLKEFNLNIPMLSSIRE